MTPYQIRVPGKWRSGTRSNTSQPFTFTERDSTQRWSIRTVTSRDGPLPLSKPFPNNAYSLHVSNWDVSNTSYSANGREYNDGPFGNPTSPFFDLSYDKPSETLLRSRALDKLNEKIRGNMNLSVDIAEAGQTLKMLKVADRVHDFTDKFYKSMRRWGKTKALSDLWLQYTYGVKPLLGSIYDAADESLRLVINRTQKFKGRATDTIVDPQFRFDTVFGTQLVKGKGLFKNSWTIGVEMYMTDFDLARWSTLNPVTIAWELVPYSFVVDWFYDVGGYLQNLDTQTMYQNRFRSGYETHLQAWNLSFDHNPFFADGYVSRTTGSANGIWLDRAVLGVYPSPSFPSFKADLGSSRLLSAAALLAQQLDSGPFGTEIRTRNPNRFRRNSRSWQSLVKGY